MDPEEQYVYTCSISHHIFTDPARADDGKFYQREEIEKWLTKSNKSPLISTPISNNLVSDEEFNDRLKDYVERCKQNNIKCDLYSPEYIINMQDETIPILTNRVQEDPYAENFLGNPARGLRCTMFVVLIYGMQFSIQFALGISGIFYANAIDCEYNSSSVTTSDYLFIEFVITFLLIFIVISATIIFLKRNSSAIGWILSPIGVLISVSIIIGSVALFKDGVYNGSYPESFPHTASNMLCFESEARTKIAVLLYSLKYFHIVLFCFCEKTLIRIRG